MVNMIVILYTFSALVHGEKIAAGAWKKNVSVGPVSRDISFPDKFLI
jgi:hypothetical protein